MSKLLVTPIFFHYNFLDKLCQEAGDILSLDLSKEESYQQFKISIFLNFNRYLMDSMAFLPGEEAENLLSQLAPAMRTADEEATINILNNQDISLRELRIDFLEIIKTLKK